MPDRTTYNYSYDADDPYVYAGTNVLINKLGLTDFDELNDAERAIYRRSVSSLLRQAEGREKTSTPLPCEKILSTDQRLPQVR